VTQIKEFYTKNRAGKALLTVPDQASVMNPVRVGSLETSRIAVVTLQGRLLVFPAAEIPVLNKGKGNKLIQIPPADLASRNDLVMGLADVPEGASLKLHCGKRHLTLSPSDLSHYLGMRARRGNHLPRGFQRVERLEVILDV